MKKVLSTLLAFAMVFGMVPTAFATPSNDDYLIVEAGSTVNATDEQAQDGTEVLVLPLDASSFPVSKSYELYQYDGNTANDYVSVSATWELKDENDTVIDTSGTDVQFDAGTATITVQSTATLSDVYTLTATVGADSFSVDVILKGAATISTTPTTTTFTYGDTVTDATFAAEASYNGSTVLDATTDFDYSYTGSTAAGILYDDKDAPSDAGTYTVTISIPDTADYVANAVSGTLIIVPKDISDVSVTITVDDAVYTGSNVNPTVTVKDTVTNKDLDENIDYTVVYTNNTDAANTTSSPAPTAAITGTGNYTSATSKTFNITAATLASAVAVSDDIDAQDAYNVKFGADYDDNDILTYVQGLTGRTTTVTTTGGASFTADLDFYNADWSNSTAPTAIDYKSGTYTFDVPVVTTSGNYGAFNVVYTLNVTAVTASYNEFVYVNNTSELAALTSADDVEDIPSVAYIITNGIDVTYSNGNTDTLAVTAVAGDAITDIQDAYGLVSTTVGYYTTELTPDIATPVWLTSISGKLTLVVTDSEIATITVSQNNEVFGGTAIAPIVTVTMPLSGDGTSSTFSYEGTLVDGTPYTGTAAPTEAGTYTVTALYQETVDVSGTETPYIGFASTSFTIEQDTPVVEATATATATVKSGKALSTVNPVVAMEDSNGNTVAGTFAWVDGSIVPTATGTYDAVFTPTSSNYKSVTVPFAVTIDTSTSTGALTDPDTSTTNSVSVTATTNGKVTVSKTNPSSGDKVIITVTPNSGYVLDTLTVKTRAGATVEYTDNGDGTYTFTYPGSAVVVTATFRVKTDADIELPFTDVAEGDWYYEAVAYAYDNNLFNGLTATLFGPNDTMTRGMMTTVLYRMAGSPNVTGTNNFTDVAAGAYYENAIIWASTAGIVNGFGNGLFAPDDTITREQMAAMLYRYAGVRNIELTATRENVVAFIDADDISSWAVAEVNAMYRAEVINGTTTGAFDPQGGATRAQVAQMLMNFLENVANA